ncbi:MAG: hypothetical protein J7L38_08630 [Thermoproteales archaeon]|nr:hypothetical protein [Thermoproteales archaeon]
MQEWVIDAWYAFDTPPTQVGGFLLLVRIHRSKGCATSPMGTIGKRTVKKGHRLIIVYTRLNDVHRVITVIDTKSLNKIVRRRIVSGRWIELW